MIYVQWETTTYFKGKDKKTLTSRTKTHSKIFGSGESQKAEKFVKEKREKGFNARII